MTLPDDTDAKTLVADLKATGVKLEIGGGSSFPNTTITNNKPLIITTGHIDNPKFNFFKSIFDYEQIKFEVERDVHKVMVLSKGHNDPSRGALVIWKDKQFHDPFQLVDYFVSNGLCKC